MAERRNHPRIEVCHPAIYSAHLYSSPKVASTLDLSIGGTRIETPYGLISGTVLEISIAIHPKVIKCKGRIVHVYRCDGERLKAGVQFEGLTEEDGLYLNEYIDTRERKKGR